MTGPATPPMPPLKAFPPMTTAVMEFRVIGVADISIAGTAQHGDGDARQRCHQARDDIGAELHQRHRHSGLVRRLRFAAHREEIFSITGGTDVNPDQQQDGNHVKGQRQAQGRRGAVQVCNVRRNAASRIRQDEERKSGVQEAGRIGGDDGLQAQVGDEKSVDRACQHTCQQGNQHKLPHLFGRAIQPNARGQDGIDNRNSPAHRNVDAAAEQHDRLPDCQQDQRQEHAHIAVERFKRQTYWAAGTN